MPYTVAAAAGAAGLRQVRMHTGPAGRSDHTILRGIAVYVAAAAGTVQLLDILVERFGWSERIFILAIIVAIVGLPLVAALCMIRDVAVAEGTPAGPVDRKEPLRTRRYGSVVESGGGSTAAQIRGTVRPFLPEPIALAGRIDLALSHRRIAVEHADARDDTGAAPHLEAFLQAAVPARDELTRLIDEAAERRRDG